MTSSERHAWTKTRAHYKKRYEDFCTSTHLVNPALLLSRVMAEELAAAPQNIKKFDDLINGLVHNSWARRIKRMRGRIGECDLQKNEHELRSLIKEAIGRAQKKGMDIHEASAHVLSPLWLRLVFTAHPTFALTNESLYALASCVLDESKQDDADMLAQAFNVRTIAPSLDDEYELASQAIQATRQALMRMYMIAFEVTESLGAKWRTPPSFGICGIASWVGYDSDGRSDITWADSFRKRLLARIAYLDETATQLRLMSDHAAPHLSSASEKMAQLSDALLEDKKASEDLLPALSAWRGTKNKNAQQEYSLDELKQASRALYEGKHGAASQGVSLNAQKLQARFGEFYDDILSLKNGKDKTFLLSRLAAMIALLKENGLSTARVHMRINASQIENALRPMLPDDAPLSPIMRQELLHNLLNKELANAQEVTINFGSLIAERMSAKRMVMIMASMLQLIDDGTAIRFLVAECESPVTLLGCLYLVRLFGIEDKIEICPLFETGKSMREGHRIIDSLLQNEHWLGYIKRQGRLCVQIGFSDSARHIGQVASVLSIENLHMQIARILKRHGLADSIKLVFFDTHGESLGRGGFAGSLAERPLYLCSPYARALFCDLGIAHEQEMSFQGGDGYLWFLDERLAFASLLRMGAGYLQFEKTLDDAPNGGARDYLKDPFYEDAELAIHFAEEVRHFNEDLMKDEGYAGLLNLFGQTMLFPSGSRPTKREDDHMAGRHMHLRPRDWRAIPHNAILHQLGMLIHVLGGIGKALERHNLACEDLLKKSPRFRHLMTNVLEAWEWAESLVLESYPAMRAPALWSAMARHTDQTDKSDMMRSTAQLLEQHTLKHDILRIIRRLTRHYDALSSWRIRHLKLMDNIALPHDEEERADFILLHGVRMALLQHLYAMLLHLPDFSYQDGFERKDIESMILHLNIPRANSLLKDMFPREPLPMQDENFGRTASYRNDAMGGYAHEHETIFEPMDEYHRMIRTIAIGLMHHIGAVG